MKKVFLSFVAALLCGIVSFAQTPISTAEEFMNIQSNGNYILANDINLGDLGERTAAIISSFSGTFDGDRYTISYQASFSGTSYSSGFGLFGSVSGTIQKLNVNASVTLSGNGSAMDVALLCGKLTGTITFCNVNGNVNSTVNPGLGGSDAGLIAGESSGTISYCTGTGNVVGVGYVGGLVGQMTGSGKVKGSSFTGNVTSVSPKISGGSGFADGLGAYGGGICGNA